MAQLSEHPSVKRFRERAGSSPEPPSTVYAQELREICLEAGADDVGFVELGFLAKERNLVWALMRRKIRIKGSPRLLLAFGKCFPS